ncbi:hydantoinase/oxoprolinase family protein [Natrarchaeobius chitinivorans]|uniref:Hydantoinase/oxoprolinase family protein n=1 Tax=Natrarchaeobius chitinivorans TaxID=1679083 RepID=A0A3N6N8U4_NATCH|nr:hydantoinase/oxoprolinase family protein [Natrarchaeobius chitinivorans]RQG94912.1 hydantoinase/oxoprolinase family protein [Natrarchaeobius chitinivorans]
MKRLAVDIGGTFVDAITFDRVSGELEIEKTSTTPSDPTEGVMDSIDQLDLDLEAVEAFVHGTTLGLNAFLEREGATTGIITNEGFRDVYEIGRTNLEPGSMYDLHYRKPDPLVPRRRRKGVPGRIDVDGEVTEPLDEQAVVEAARDLVEERGAESIAVCFLHAYRNQSHERRAAELVREAYPDVSVSISSDIAAEYREYERTSTAVFDAYIKPIFENYVDELDRRLGERGFDEAFYVTRSGGGTLSAASATRTPVQTILSGPAGGIIGASAVGDATGRSNLIAVDIGGTSTDACVIEDGTPAIQYEAGLEHLPMMIPVYDIRTIGAGGGSIAWVDSGLLKVGPNSAGADPGPICYDRGGDRPTVTDAALALGYINPDGLLGGEMRLDASSAVDGIERELADPLGTSVREAATGVLEVTTAKAVGAIREITVERGLDPREFTLAPFGGAGPLLGALFARELDIPEVMVPRAPSVFSAWGMLMADVVYDVSEMYIEVVDELEESVLDSKFETLEAEALDALEREGFDREDGRLERTLEMRYFGQEHTVDVPADGVVGPSELSERFERVHRDRYGHTMDDPAEVVSLRVRATGRNDKPTLETPDAPEPDAEPVDRRDAYCFAAGEMIGFDVYERSRLAPGETVSGPAVVEQPTTTTVVHSDQTAVLDEFGNIVVDGGDGR